MNRPSWTNTCGGFHNSQENFEPSSRFTRPSSLATPSRSNYRRSILISRAKTAARLKPAKLVHRNYARRPRPISKPAPGTAALGLPLESSWPVLDGYDIQAVLGSGGMGTVYRAYDRERRRSVALKVMNRAGNATIVRFKHEFRTLLGVAHPNLVTLYELIFDGKNWFLTMELLEGVNFLQYVRDEALPVADSEILLQRNCGQHQRNVWIRPGGSGYARRLASLLPESHGFMRRESCTATSNRRM